MLPAFPSPAFRATDDRCWWRSAAADDVLGRQRLMATQRLVARRIFGRWDASDVGRADGRSDGPGNQVDRRTDGGVVRRWPRRTTWERRTWGRRRLAGLVLAGCSERQLLRTFRTDCDPEERPAMPDDSTARLAMAPPSPDSPTTVSRLRHRPFAGSFGTLVGRPHSCQPPPTAQSRRTFVASTWCCNQTKNGEN